MKVEKYIKELNYYLISEMFHLRYSKSRIMASNIVAAFIILTVCHLEVNSAFTPNFYSNVTNAVTFSNNLLNIYYENREQTDIISTLRTISIKIKSLIKSSPDNIEPSKSEDFINLPDYFHPPQNIANYLKKINAVIKQTNRLFYPFYYEYLNQNISLISLKALITKASSAELSSLRNNVYRIYQNILPREKLGDQSNLFNQLIEFFNTNLYRFCFFKNPRKYVIYLFESLVKMELRVFVMSTFAFTLQSLLTNFDYTQTINQIKDRHEIRRFNYILKIQEALSKESNEFFYCQPKYDDDYTLNHVFAVSLLAKESNYRNNRVVTGIRFTIKKKILHLQLEEGKVMPGGNIELGSERWIPVDNLDYDSGTFDNNGNITPLHDDVECHYIAPWDYLHFTDVKVPENSVVVGAKFEVYYLHPKEVSNKTIIYLRLKYAEIDSATGQINSSNVKYSDALERTSPELEYQFEKFKTNSDEDNEYVNFGYAALGEKSSREVLAFIDSQDINLDKYTTSKTPLNGIGLYKNYFFVSQDTVSLKIFTVNKTPLFEYMEDFY